jgi:transcription antitermination factor NusG
MVFFGKTCQRTKGFFGKYIFLGFKVCAARVSFPQGRRGEGAPAPSFALVRLVSALFHGYYSINVQMNNTCLHLVSVFKPVMSF